MWSLFTHTHSVFFTWTHSQIHWDIRNAHILAHSQKFSNIGAYSLTHEHTHKFPHVHRHTHIWSYPHSLTQNPRMSTNLWTCLQIHSHTDIHICWQQYTQFHLYVHRNVLANSNTLMQSLEHRFSPVITKLTPSHTDTLKLTSIFSYIHENALTH